MREGFEIISGGKTGRMFLFGAVVAVTAALAIAFSVREGAHQPLASADTAGAPSSAPAGAGYIKFDGIDGEAVDKGHESWSEILSFSQSVSAPVTASAAGSARTRATPKTRDLVITKRVDKATPKLMEYSLSGTAVSLVSFEVSADGAEGEGTYLKYELTNVLITNYRAGGSASGDSRPTETLSLNFEEIKVTYVERDATGKATGEISSGWDVVRNRKAP